MRVISVSVIAPGQSSATSFTRGTSFDTTHPFPRPLSSELDPTGPAVDDFAYSLTLPTEQFTRRFLLHILPRSFHRMHHYGLLASGLLR
jgi:hypothetical protein